MNNDLKDAMDADLRCIFAYCCLIVVSIVLIVVSLCLLFTT